MPIVAAKTPAPIAMARTVNPIAIAMRCGATRLCPQIELEHRQRQKILPEARNVRNGP